MKYGAPVYRQCAHCKQAIEIVPLLDGSHKGSVLWSDGFVESLMMPEQAIVAKCNNCAEVVWLTNLIPVSYPESETITGYKRLTAEDYLELVQQPLPEDTQQKVFLRTMAWQKNNNSRRGREERVAYSEAEVTNMRELDDLLGGEWENELLMKIEIARELGDFEKAENLMKDVDFSLQIQHLTEQLTRWIEQKYTTVKAFQTQGFEEETHTS